MKYIEVESYEDMSEIASEIIARQIKRKSNCVLGLATGSTPVGTYKELINKNKEKQIDFSLVTTINLDEYVGLDSTHKQSYRRFMDENLFNHINIDKNNTHLPIGTANNVQEECGRYDEIIEKNHGLDLLLLGIGVDGHIGFNEPDKKFIKNTHIVKLDKSTIDANSRFFDSKEEVPEFAITMGMGAIMGAKEILLIANGSNKKDILDKAIYGDITAKIPASILQLHPNVTIIYSKN